MTLGLLSIEVGVSEKGSVSLRSPRQGGPGQQGERNEEEQRDLVRLISLRVELIGSLEVGEEAGVDDHIGMSGEIGIGLIFWPREVLPSQMSMEELPRRARFYLGAA